MVRTVVAFESEKDQEAIAGVLEKSGITVRFRCRTGLETIRAVKQMGGGIVVAGYKFPDMTTENLAWQLKDDGVTVLMVAKGASDPYKGVACRSAQWSDACFVRCVHY